MALKNTPRQAAIAKTLVKNVKNYNNRRLNIINLIIASAQLNLSTVRTMPELTACQIGQMSWVIVLRM